MAGDVAVTVTPGSTAPWASVTRPWMVPVLLAPPPWANAAGTDKAATSAVVSRPTNQRFIDPPTGRVGTDEEDRLPPRTTDKRDARAAWKSRHAGPDTGAFAAANAQRPEN